MHAKGVWRALCQMSEHGAVAAEMLAGLGAKGGEEALLGCPVVPGNDALEGLANLLEAAVVLRPYGPAHLGGAWMRRRSKNKQCCSYLSSCALTGVG
jgi:hypothetical protein